MTKDPIISKGKSENELRLNFSHKFMSKHNQVAFVVPVDFWLSGRRLIRMYRKKAWVPMFNIQTSRWQHLNRFTPFSATAQ